ncbi:MAG: hypothetical protein FRX48_04960 [Lasallia pustulata]|uniref:Uncharacterized protein n=1 Tax=Lasallia pustulata TaxID=136370 RepID=A0A5M8PRS2_9LECA|nr:MAG: hypothetical protein FRX48_04960 [Lasallia pustulata]
MVSASDAQRNSQSKVESTSSNSSSTEVSPRTKPASSPGAGTDLIPLVGPKRCSYIKGCSTESPERKVTSHLFGRNKNCTKQIPDSVWLWYCRKHYQRTRYRDRVAFTKLQLDSVRRQVQRLRAWGGVREWEVILKKSEKTRLYNYTLEHAKKSEKNGLSASDRSTGNEDGRGEANPTRPGATPEVGHPAALVGKQMQFNEKVCDDRVDTDDELDSDDEDDEESNKVLGKNKNRRKQKKKTEQELPPLCHFMVPYLGRGKTFEDIEEVLKAVKVYLQGTDLPFPAIELLPYSETPALPRRASSATVRTRNPQPTAAAKRKASDSTSGSSDMPPPASRTRRSPADDDKDEVGDMATASPRKRRPVAGGSTNQSNTLPPPSPLKRRTSTRGRKSQLEPDCQVTQAKQAPNRGQASGGGRR